MVTSVLTAMVQGVEGILIRAEADISSGLPMMNVFGSLAPESREGKERVRTALKNMGISLPPSRITINLAPGDIRKSGTSFDLAIAVALFIAMGYLPAHSAEDILFLGELSLDGSLTPVHGVLPMLIAARKEGCHKCIVPYDNLEEASLLDDMEPRGFSCLMEVFDFLSSSDREAEGWGGEDRLSRKNPATPLVQDHIPIPRTDFAEVRGQQLAKRALEIAVAGFHNVFLDGPPGVGKSMVASCVPGIMPEMTMEEKIETTMIYSVKGLLGNSFFLVKDRPFRAPSHNITMVGMFGGGADPVPGEISLAHHGVLFLDEFPEHRREMIEMMRIPLEDHRMILVRNNRSICFPSDFILIAAANPCPCGYYPDQTRCSCSQREIRRYRSRISGPVRDRIDLFVRCEDLEYDVLTGQPQGESSREIRKRVTAAWDRQRQRSSEKAYHFNGRMTSSEVRKYCRLTKEGERLMASSYRQMGLSGRGYYRILKVSRTIADLEGEETVGTSHLEEALLFRNVGI